MNRLRTPLTDDFIDTECLLTNINALAIHSARLVEAGRLSVDSIDLIPYPSAIAEAGLPRWAVSTIKVQVEHDRNSRIAGGSVSYNDILSGGVLAEGYYANDEDDLGDTLPYL